MRLDFFGLLGHRSSQRRNHGGEAIKTRVSGLHLFSSLRDLCGVRSELCGVRSELLVVLQLLIVKPAQRRPKLLEAAE